MHASPGHNRNAPLMKESFFRFEMMGERRVASAAKGVSQRVSYWGLCDFEPRGS